MTNTFKLIVNELAAERAEQRLFQKLNLELAAGELLQVLGPNGVGKSTLLKILAGLRPPDSGFFRWEDSIRYQNHLAYLGHRLGLKLKLSVHENLSCSHNPPLSLVQVLEGLKLADCQHSLVGKLSQGQRQRVALARVCLSGKQIWILDEPFSALDEQGFKLFQMLLQSHLQAGGLVILSSHRPLEFTQNVQTLLLGKNDER